MTGVAARDSLYVGALLGVTPILQAILPTSPNLSPSSKPSIVTGDTFISQDKFVQDYGCGVTSAGLYASVPR